MTMVDPPGIGRPLAAALAEELVLATQILGELAYDLGSDPDTLRRHMTSLQKIDLVTQMQLAVADLLRMQTACDDVAAMVTLEATAARLRDAIG